MTTLTYSLPNDSGLGGNVTIRQLIQNTNGGVVTITFKAAAGSSCVINKTYIGPAATSPSASSLQQVFFGGAASTGTIAAGATKSSDPLNIGDVAQDLIISFHISTGEVGFDSGAAGTDNWFKTGVDEAATPTVSGYTHDTANSPIGVSSFVALPGALRRQPALQGGF
jgi:hypothetical protein